MAQKLQEFPKRPHGAGRHFTGNDEWLNGEIWQLDRLDLHMYKSLDSAIGSLRHRALTCGWYKLITQRTSDGKIIVQAVQENIGHPFDYEY